jgi:hypothetical protein
MNKNSETDLSSMSSGIFFKQGPVKINTTKKQNEKYPDEIKSEEYWDEIFQYKTTTFDDLKLNSEKIVNHFRRDNEKMTPFQ